MADPITIITSAASAAAIALKVSKTVSQLITAVGEAPDDVQALKAEVDGVHSAVMHIHRILQEQNSHWNPIWGQDVESALDRTGDDLMKIHLLVSKWSGSGKIGKTGKTTKVLKGIQWVFKDSEIGRLTKRIESSKSALLLLIGTISLASNGRIDQQVNDVHDRVQALIAERVVDNEKSAQRYAPLEYRNDPGSNGQMTSGPSRSNYNNNAPSYEKIASSPSRSSDEYTKGISRYRVPQFVVTPQVDNEANFEKDQQISALTSRLSQLELANKRLVSSKDGQISKLYGELSELRGAAQSAYDHIDQKFDTRGQDSAPTSLTNALQQIVAQSQALEEQNKTWRAKYEGLAKLYSQLRLEHLDLLQKYKALQLSKLQKTAETA